MYAGSEFSHTRVHIAWMCRTIELWHGDTTRAGRLSNLQCLRGKETKEHHVSLITEMPIIVSVTMFCGTYIQICKKESAGNKELMNC